MMWDCECRPSKAPKGTKRAPLAITNHPHPFKHRIEGQVSCGVCTCVVPPATPRPISGPQLLQLLQLRSCLSRRGAAGPRRSLDTPVWRSNRIRVLPSGNPDDNATGQRLVWQTRRWKKILRGWGDGISDGDGGSLACLSHWQFGLGIGIASVLHQHRLVQRQHALLCWPCALRDPCVGMPHHLRSAPAPDSCQLVSDVMGGSTKHAASSVSSASSASASLKARREQASTSAWGSHGGETWGNLAACRGWAGRHRPGRQRPVMSDVCLVSPYLV
ncbi:hypothetical protein EDB80DRAFT_134836 [Ilyonectria destructans]|nr:hypothetical protein EDB80DRAFT_134836 [Ilyonectria destructans]